MPILKPIQSICPYLIAGGPDAINVNNAVALAAGNTVVSMGLSKPCSRGTLRVKTDPLGFGANAQVRIINVQVDDGTNACQMYIGDYQIHGINQNIEYLQLWTWDHSSATNVNVAINVINGTTNFSFEVTGLI